MSTFYIAPNGRLVRDVPEGPDLHVIRPVMQVDMSDAEVAEVLSRPATDPVRLALEAVLEKEAITQAAMLAIREGAGEGGVSDEVQDYVNAQIAAAIAALPEPEPGGGGGTKFDAAALEPDALMPIQLGTFSLPITDTRLVIGAWQTQIGGAGRWEQRVPGAHPLNNVTLTGTGSDSTAVLVNPDAVAYTDAAATVAAREEKLRTERTRVITLPGPNTTRPLLPGPYGAIVTHAVCFDAPWLVLRHQNGVNYGSNLMNEINDTDDQRVAHSIRFPINKAIAGVVSLSNATGVARGSLTMVLCDSTWSAFPDPISATYTFRDDFMGTALDTTKWGKVEASLNGVEIDTTYQWCKLTGTGGWGLNGMYSKVSHARSAAPTLVVDVYAGAGSAVAGALICGFRSTTGDILHTNFAHSINLGQSGGNGQFQVIESGGSSLGAVGSGWTENCVYRLRFQVQPGGGCIYSVQGGTQYPAIGSASWTTLTPGTPSAASAATLYAGASAYSGPNFVSDFRVF